jgi:argininosuccinate lyase
MQALRAAWDVADQNPLGSAAGYGSSFPLDRTLTSRLLGFSTLSYNVVFAQMGRGKSELFLSYALSALGSTLNKLASDVCLYMGQNFGFLTFPAALTTGSSIMPHKKNPDVFELIRARTNRLLNLPAQVAQLLSNLPSGYHRDLQLLKEFVFPALDEAKSCLQLTDFMLQQIQVSQDIVEDPRYDYLFTVEAVNREVLAGIPFREAYQKIGQQIQDGTYQPNREVVHTHEGSIGQLCHAEIQAKLDRVMSGFAFSRLDGAFAQLLSEAGPSLD